MMSEPKLNTKIFNSTDFVFFSKCVKMYIFFNQDYGSKTLPELEQGMEEGRNLVYSTIKSYFEKDKFEITYLEELNNLLREIFDINKNHSFLTIPPQSIDELELKELTPIQFSDEDGSTLSILFNEKEKVCMWSQYLT